MKLYGKMESGQNINHFNFGGHTISDPDPRFMNRLAAFLKLCAGVMLSPLFAC